MLQIRGVWIRAERNQLVVQEPLVNLVTRHHGLILYILHCLLESDLWMCIAHIRGSGVNQAKLESTFQHGILMILWSVPSMCAGVVASMVQPCRKVDEGTISAEPGDYVCGQQIEGGRGLSCQQRGRRGLPWQANLHIDRTSHARAHRGLAGHISHPTWSWSFVGGVSRRR